MNDLNIICTRCHKLYIMPRPVNTPAHINIMGRTLCPFCEPVAGDYADYFYIDPLIIITPCSRPQNLPAMALSINHALAHWIIIHDASEVPGDAPIYPNTVHIAVKGGVMGNLQRNTALDLIKTPAWLYVLDDDNIIHPDFMTGFINLLHQHRSHARGFIFAQYMPKYWPTPESIPEPRTRVITADLVREGEIDQAQFIIHTDLIGTTRYQQKYSADGIFIETIYKQYPQRFVITPQVLAYYNFLQQ
jgi:hypothetical protein